APIKGKATSTMLPRHALADSLPLLPAYKMAARTKAPSTTFAHKAFQNSCTNRVRNLIIRSRTGSGTKGIVLLGALKSGGMDFLDSLSPHYRDGPLRTVLCG